MVTIKKRYFAVIGLGLFAWILWNSNIAKISGYILRVDPIWLVIAIAMGLSTLAIKGYRWALLFRAISEPKHKSEEMLPVKATAYFAIGFFWGILTPGRVGDFIRAVYAKRYNVSLSKSISSVVIDRLIDVVFLFVLSAIAIISFSFLFGFKLVPFYLLAAALILLCIALWVFFNKKLMKAILRPFFNAFIPEGKKGTLAEGFSSFYSSFAEMRSKKAVLAKAVSLTILSWAVSILSAYFLSLAFGLAIPLEFYALVVPILGLLDIIPISISGIGTRDAALILLFSFYKIGAEAAIAFSIVYLFAFYWLTALIGAFLFMHEPVKIEI